MECCASLRGVHFLAADQRRECFNQVPCLCQFEQRLPRSVIQPMLGEIQNESVCAAAKLVGPVGFSVEQGFDASIIERRCGVQQTIVERRGCSVH